MAATLNMEETDAEADYFACCSRQKLDEITDRMETHFVEMINSISQLTEKQKLSCRNRFRPVFEKFLLPNIILTENTTDKDHQAVASDKQNYLLDTVYPKLEETLVATTRKRKMYPQICVQHLEKRFRLNREFLENQKMNTAERKKIEAEVNLYSTADSTMQELFTELADKIATQKQRIEPLTNLVQRVNESRNILHSKGYLPGQLKFHSCNEKSSSTAFIHKLQPSQPEFNFPTRHHDIYQPNLCKFLKKRSSNEPPQQRTA